MPAFRAALDQLAALAVPGVAHNYALAAVPESLARAQLPALLVLPGDTQDRRLFKNHGAGFQALAFSGSAPTMTVAVTHLLLVAPAQSASGPRSHLPRLVDLIDAYLAALAADLLLGGALVEPTRVQIEPGLFSYADIAYHGCAFRHTLHIQV